MILLTSKVGIVQGVQSFDFFTGVDGEGHAGF